MSAKRGDSTARNPGVNARRRTIRLGEEYRTPTDEEWDVFLATYRTVSG
ncbi:hypothetical protein AB0M12_29440 [Nocardia vinacea]